MKNFLIRYGWQIVLTACFIQIMVVSLTSNEAVIGITALTAVCTVVFAFWLSRNRLPLDDFNDVSYDDYGDTVIHHIRRPDVVLILLVSVFLFSSCMIDGDPDYKEKNIPFARPALGWKNVNDSLITEMNNRGWVVNTAIVPKYLPERTTVMTNTSYDKCWVEYRFYDVNKTLMRSCVVVYPHRDDLEFGKVYKYLRGQIIHYYSNCGVDEISNRMGKPTPFYTTWVTIENTGVPLVLSYDKEENMFVSFGN